MDFISLYDWQKMSQKQLDFTCSIILPIIEDFILLNDWFVEFNTLINPKDGRANVECYLEGQINGLAPAFTLGGIEHKQHIMILEDLAFEIMIASRGKSISVEDRVSYIIAAWQEKLPELKQSS